MYDETRLTPQDFVLALARMGFDAKVVSESLNYPVGGTV
jgi:hypothetical protein